MIGEKPTKKVKAQVDLVFFRQMKQLLKITVPGVFSTESAFLVLVAASLVARSICDIWMIQNGTLVETALINMDRPLFWKRLLFFFSGMPLVSFLLDSMLEKLTLEKLGKTWLTLEKLLKFQKFCKMGHCKFDPELDSDSVTVFVLIEKIRPW